jgi:DNA-binding transcriptional MerR regulator
MLTEDLAVRRRQHMVRALREAGVSFEEIVAILRVGEDTVQEHTVDTESRYFSNTEWMLAQNRRVFD